MGEERVVVVGDEAWLPDAWEKRQRRLARMREYGQRPEQRAKKREYEQRPEVREMRRAYQRELRRLAAIARVGAPQGSGRLVA